MNTQKFQIEDVVYFIEYNLEGEMEVKKGAVLSMTLSGSVRIEVGEWPGVFVRESFELYKDPAELRQKQEEYIMDEYRKQMAELNKAFENIDLNIQLN